MFTDICFGFWSQVHSFIIWGGQRPHLLFCLKIQVHRSVSEGLMCSLYSKAVTLWDLGILLFSFPCLCVTQTCVTFYPAIFSPVAHRPAPKGQFGQPWQLVLPSVSGGRRRQESLLQLCSLPTPKSLNVYTEWLSSLDTDLVSWQQHLLIQISLLLTCANGMLCDHMQVLILPRAPRPL